MVFKGLTQGVELSHWMRQELAEGAEGNVGGSQGHTYLFQSFAPKNNGKRTLFLL